MRARNSLKAGGSVMWLAWALAIGTSQAQMPGTLDPRSLLEAPGPIATRADKLDVNRETGDITADGNVVIRKGDVVLKADHVRCNVNTEGVKAWGNVELRRGEDVWRGESVNGNFRTREWDAINIGVESRPFVVEASRTSRGAANSYELEGARVTTCTNGMGDAHYSLSARRLTLVPGENLSGYGAVLRLGSVPVMYLPYWSHSLQEDSGWRLRPGYSSRWGAYLLSSYRYRLNPYLRAETHLDGRTERGLAVGQDFKWADTNSLWHGDLALYYADDSKPVDEDTIGVDPDLDNERYRIRARHQVNLSDRDYLLAQGNYLSDPEILEDFFEREFRNSREPENYASLMHRGEGYTAGALLQSRLNDFYESVDRLPEFTLDVVRRQLGDSGFYYESASGAAFLQKRWSSVTTNADDYSTFRFDSSHMVYYPGKYFGFLNVVPRGGARVTYYSDTRETERTLVSVRTTVTNRVVRNGFTNLVVTTGTQTNTLYRDIARGSDVRALAELGAEFSFKAFKAWEGGVVTPLRHIVEPYANYTLVPKPSVEPESLYQFDRVDALDQQHIVLLGTRNKLQTKQEDRPFDILDADFNTILNLDPDADQESFTDVYGDIEWRPTGWFSLDVDGIVNVDQSELSRFNGRAVVHGSETWESYLEYRYRLDESSLLLADITFSPNRDWSLNGYTRYEFENDARLEEVGCKVRRNLDCMVIRTGLGALPGYTRSDGSERDDEIRVVFELWLTAFPEVGISGEG